MTVGNKDPVVVVVELNGGNDYLNTVVPYTDPNYHDNRVKLRLGENEVHKIDDRLGFHPAMGPLKDVYDRGDMAIVHGVGYENPSRSHFRSMDIWHTCEPVKVGDEGWIGRASRQIDPKGENPIGTVNIGHGLPRALVAPGVSVASVADLSSYGLFTGVERESERERMLARFAAMYAPGMGSGPVSDIMDYLSLTGKDAMKGADILKAVPSRYESTIEYGADSISQSLRSVAMVHTADVGSRFFYTTLGSFDTHGSQEYMHGKLWTEASRAIVDFWDDLRQHDADENVVMLLFSEFGRRVKENGEGTDHGSGGVAFAIGPGVAGGMYSEYPDTRVEALVDGDLEPNLDFRGLYSTVLEDWLGLDAEPIVNGRFEKPAFIAG